MNESGWTPSVMFVAIAEDTAEQGRACSGCSKPLPPTNLPVQFCSLFCKDAVDGPGIIDDFHTETSDQL